MSNTDSTVSVFVHNDLYISTVVTMRGTVLKIIIIMIVINQINLFGGSSKNHYFGS
jgi:hypothetical protein